MNSRKPSADLRPAPGALPAAEARPMGLLYTILRHGRGLSHEEAHRESFESTGDQPPKAA